MSPAILELDVETIAVSDPDLSAFATPKDALRADAKQGLTPGTVNTYPVGVGRCPSCC